MFDFKKILQKIKNLDKLTVIKTATDLATGRLIDGKEEYVIKFNYGALPNNDVKGVNTGLPNSYNCVRIFGIARKSDGTRYWILPNQNVKVDFENGWVTITTFEDLSDFNATFEIYYTKD